MAASASKILSAFKENLFYKFLYYLSFVKSCDKTNVTKFIEYPPQPEYIYRTVQISCELFFAPVFMPTNKLPINNVESTDMDANGYGIFSAFSNANGCATVSSFA